MTKTEAIKFINDYLKKANPEQIRAVLCGCFSPRCNADCPLKIKGSYECADIIFEETEEKSQEKIPEVEKDIPKKVEKSQKNLEKKLKSTLLLF